MTVEIETRFNHASISVCSGLVIILWNLVSLIYKNVNWKKKLFVDHFKEDFPYLKALQIELDLWETYWLKIKDCLRGNISSSFKCIQFNDFNNIKVSLRFISISSVTTCTCELSFFAMRRPKTYARSIIGLERLNDITLMHVNQ